MLEEYESKGLIKCMVKGKLRWSSGKIEDGGGTIEELNVVPLS